MLLPQNRLELILADILPATPVARDGDGGVALLARLGLVAGDIAADRARADRRSLVHRHLRLIAARTTADRAGNNAHLGRRHACVLVQLRLNVRVPGGADLGVAVLGAQVFATLLALVTAYAALLTDHVAAVRARCGALIGERTVGALRHGARPTVAIVYARAAFMPAKLFAFVAVGCGAVRALTHLSGAGRRFGSGAGAAGSGGGRR